MAPRDGEQPLGNTAVRHVPDENIEHMAYAVNGENMMQCYEDSAL